jgi:hypothetical protein
VHRRNNLRDNVTASSDSREESKSTGSNVGRTVPVSVITRARVKAMVFMILVISTFVTAAVNYHM